VFRLFILVTIILVGFGLACSPAMAEEPQQDASATTIEKAEKTVVPLPTKTRRTRLSTRDRWRGKPYVRSSADETVRSHALDMALPPANPAFQGGASLNGPGVFSYEGALRNELLNQALPPANPAFVGGSTISGGVGF
jgi:hypothetical protein